MTMFLVWLSEIGQFVFQKKKCFSYDNNVRCHFLFSDELAFIHRFVDLMDAQKVIKACLMLVVVFPVCFSEIEFFVT